MKFSIIILIICCSTQNLFCQKEAANWYFGDRVGLNFNSSPPTPLQHEFRIDEGCATISDKRGKLLFYSNGVIIHNREHNLMKNGDGLYGHLSSTQNAIIIQKPGSDSLYYIFTVGAAVSSKGLNYSVVNMRGDSGRGEVIQKNIHLLDDVHEKIAAVRHCNKKDVWIAVEKFNSDSYYTFLLTSSGINTIPIQSNTGLIINGSDNNTVGAMKFSNDSKKFAAVYGYEKDIIEIMDFDNITGRFSNPLSFRCNSDSPTARIPGVYGVEISPNNKLMYVTSSDGETYSYIYQFDISLNNTNAILSSKNLIVQWHDPGLAALQIAIDKKIYVSIWNDNYISVINDPDVSGAGCDFQADAIMLTTPGQGTCLGGLPSFLQSYFNPDANPYTFSRSGNCIDKLINFQLNNINNIDSVKWNFGDNNFSSSLNSTHRYNNSGFYNVSVIVYKRDCSGENDTATNSIWIANNNSFLGNDTAFCKTKSFALGYSVNEASYLWNTGSTNDYIYTDTAGIYWLQIEQNGCTITDTIKVDVRNPPVVDLGNDTGICFRQTLLLDAKNPGANYLWSTGATTQTLIINAIGTYSVAVTAKGCTTKDTIKISYGDCGIIIPDAFTPNGNNLNDYFGVLNGQGFNQFDMKIFDRWGNIIYHSKDVLKKWDGKYKNQILPEGVYLWTIEYNNSLNKHVKEKGIVTLLR